METIKSTIVITIAIAAEGVIPDWLSSLTWKVQLTF